MESGDRLSIRRPSAFDDRMNKRPLAVLLIGCVYIVTGAGGFAAHFSELKARHPFENDAAWVELVSLVALVSGVYLLRGRNWARWLALAWMGIHVILSTFHTRLELAVHVLFFAVLTYFLFRPAAARYFRTARAIR
jgi:hypothetical protein